MKNMCRRMTRADLADVLELDTLYFPKPFSKRSIHATYQHPSTEAFVAELDDVVVGYVFASKDMYSADIVRIAVMQSARAGGIGRSLLARVAAAVGDDMSIEMVAKDEALAFFLQKCDFQCVRDLKKGWLFRKGSRFSVAPQLKFRF